MKNKFQKLPFKKKMEYILLCTILPAAWLIDKTMRAGKSLHQNRKGALASVLALAMLFTMLPMTAFAESTKSAVDYWDGTTDTTWYYEHQSDTEYSITTAEQLAGLAQICKDYTTLTGNRAFENKTVSLDTDIILNENVLDENGELNSGTFKEWTPIGDLRNEAFNYIENAFYGVFDGQGHIISGMVITQSGENSAKAYSAGLFGYTRGAIIKNFTVCDSYIEGSVHSGGIAGRAMNSAFDGLVFDGTIKADGSDMTVGGILGYMQTYFDNGGEDHYNDNQFYSITNCVNLGRLELLNGNGNGIYCAGICGYATRNLYSNIINVKNCLNAGTQNLGKNICTYQYGSTRSSAYNHCYVLNKAPGETGFDDAQNTLTSDYIYITDAQLQSGMIAYELNQNAGSNYFGQNIGTDKAPVLDGLTVYKISCSNSYGYSNTNQARTEHTYVDGVCTCCLYEHPESEHAWVLSNVTEATCGEDGKQDKICSICGKTVINEVIPATKQHTYGSDHICSVCGFIDCVNTGEHSYDSNGFCIGCDDYEPAVLNETTGYYEVSNAGQLFWISAYLKSTAFNFRLVSDIDLNPGYTFNADGTYTGGDSPRQWQPIGSASTYFTGNFDGCGHTVKNLYINSASVTYGALFGRVFTGQNSNSIKNVTVTGYVSTYAESAGIIAYANGSSSTKSLTVSDCSSYVHLARGNQSSQSPDAGGIIAYFLGNGLLDIHDCANYGTINYAVNDKYSVGGILGTKSGNTVTLTNCLNVGTVTGGTGTRNSLTSEANASFVNCYSLNETATADGLTSLTADEMAEPSVAWKLNTTGGVSANSGIWTQNGTYPLFADEANNAVYRVNVSGVLNETYYTNRNGYITLPVEYSYTSNGISFNDSEKISEDIELLSSEVINEIISVDIIWGSMEFTYVDASEGTWNPLTHQYENATDAGWTCDTDANKITVTSESNVPLYASFNYAQTDSAVSGQLVTINGNEFNSLSLPAKVDSANSACAVLKLNGKPTETQTTATLGTVTVTIASDYEKNGLVTIDDDTYYYTADGTLATGWRQLQTGEWYYFESDGKARKSAWIEDSGNKYYLGADGKMVTGWLILNGEKYYFGNTGTMQTGYQQINGDWYYFYPETGIMAHDVTINSYVFGPDGKWNKQGDMV